MAETQDATGGSVEAQAPLAARMRTWSAGRWWMATAPAPTREG